MSLGVHGRQVFLDGRPLSMPPVLRLLLQPFLFLLALPLTRPFPQHNRGGGSVIMQARHSRSMSEVVVSL